MALVKKEEPKKEKVPETIQTLFGLYKVEAGVSKCTPVSTTNDNLLCGVELEIENLPRGIGFYQEALDGKPWSVEEDGSLRPRGEAWEFISHPLRLNYLLPEMEGLFRNLDIREDRNYSDRCSVHLHTNVQDWSRDNLASLALVYPVFEAVLFQYINHYKAKEEQGYCRDTNLYCIPWSDCRHNRKFVDNLFNNPSQIRYWQKYTALNFLPVLDKGTVEWRHMHGTCDMEKLTTWFNLIGAIMAYCRATDFHSIVHRILLLNDVSTYQQFYEEVLKGSLPYSDEYRRSMAEGVVNAKYSLVTFEKNKNQPREKSSKESLLEAAARAAGDLGGLGRWADNWDVHPPVLGQRAQNPAAEIPLDGARMDRVIRAQRQQPPQPRDPLAIPVPRVRR